MFLFNSLNRQFCNEADQVIKENRQNSYLINDFLQRYIGVGKSKEFEFNLLNITEVEHSIPQIKAFKSNVLIAENELECLIHELNSYKICHLESTILISETLYVNESMINDLPGYPATLQCNARSSSFFKVA